MSHMIKVIIGILCGLAVSAIDPANARGGRFVGSLVTRGVVHSGAAFAKKTYGPDVLSTQQLTDCLRKANQLDSDDGNIEADRDRVRARFSQIDILKSEIERSQATLNRYSQRAIDRFNATVDQYNALLAEARTMQTAFNRQVERHNSDVTAHNVICAKRYYADDLDTAKRAAGLQ